MSQYASFDSRGVTNVLSIENTAVEQSAGALFPISQSTAALAPVDRQALEVQAEQLMDDLFKEVELILVETTPLAPPAGQLRTTSAATLSVQMLLGRQTSALSPKILTAFSEPPRQPEVSSESTEAVAELKHLQQQRSLDGMFLGAGGMALLLGLASWLAGQVHWPFSPPPAPIVAQQTAPVADPFFDYLRRSLQRLDSTTPNQSTNQPFLLSSAAHLPPVLPSVSPVIPAEPLLRSEKIASVPQQNWTTPSPSAPSSTSLPPLPTVSATGSADPLPAIPVAALPPPPPLAETLSPPQRSQSAPLPSLNASTPPAANSLPDPPPILPAPPSIPAAPVAAPVVAPASPQPVAAASLSKPALGGQYTLTGVMEMGNQSVALVEINGITRRVQVGEAIDTSGWRLQSIGNQEAVIQRNQAVNTIQVGQQF